MCVCVGVCVWAIGSEKGQVADEKNGLNKVNDRNLLHLLNSSSVALRRTDQKL